MNRMGDSEEEEEGGSESAEGENNEENVDQFDSDEIRMQMGDKGGDGSEEPADDTVDQNVNN